MVAWDNPAPEHLNGNVDRYWVCRQRVNDSLTLPELARLPWPDETSEEQMSNRLVREKNIFLQFTRRGWSVSPDVCPVEVAFQSWPGKGQ